ncbi:hypothetical protein GCM10010446_61450 [Streptomyces enissocaesilis]|uniref:Uncharacterized protein n=1 Tax=Streptomyces enissocaesilis TaxID=332589 RepID=A0ABP6K6K9_9ACTN
MLGVFGVLGVLGALLLGVGALSGVRPGAGESEAFGLGVTVGVAAGDCVVLAGAGCLGSWLEVVDSGRFGWGVRVSAEPGAPVLGVVAAPGVGVGAELGVLGLGARPGVVPGAGWFG